MQYKFISASYIPIFGRSISYCSFPQKDLSILKFSLREQNLATTSSSGQIHLALFPAALY